MAQNMTRRSALQGMTLAPCLLSISGYATYAATTAGSDYFGVVDMPGGRIALSTDGQQMVAYLCDGTDDHAPTLARWMRGTVSAGAFKVGANGVSVSGQISGDKASGTVVRPNGIKHAFLAGSRLYGSTVAGLYRAEATFNGVRYVGGWIVNPNRHTASLPEGQDVHLVSWQTPVARDIAKAAPITRVSFELEDEYDDYPRPGGAVTNQATGAALPYYTAPNFATMTADLPELGSVRLVRCVQTKCA